MPVTTAERARTLTAGISDAEIPRRIANSLEAALESREVRIFEVRARRTGMSHWPTGQLAAVCLLGGRIHARLLLWRAEADLPLEQVEDALGRLLILAFNSSPIDAVHTQLGLEAGRYFWPAVRMGFAWADDPTAARDGTQSLTMTRRRFASLLPWGKEISCSS